MRIEDLIEADASNIYSIGDSHAEGISYDKRVINRAYGGQASTSQTNYNGVKDGRPTGLDNVPEGSNVIIAQGANDTANSARAHIDSKGKKPLVPPQTIANNVAKVVNAARAKKCKVVFVLFPNGNGRAPGLAKYYSGDYQDEVRQAIKSAVGVTVIDLDGKGLSSDGIHGTPTAYKTAAAEAIQSFGNVNTQAVATKPTGSDQKPSPTNTSGFKITVPEVSVGHSGADVMDVQKALVALGFDVGPPGIDGIRGKYTIGAIKKYQEARGLTIDGDAGPETVTALNKDIASAPDKFKGITNSKPEDVKIKTRRHSSNEPLPDLKVDAVTSGKIGDILNYVARYESAGHYDIMNGGQRHPKILKMTMNELFKFQGEHRRQTGNSTAAGRYQIMDFNTIPYARKAGLDPDKDIFSPENQDKMGIIFLREKGLEGWLQGQMSDKAFQEGLSMVWAALPSVSKNGRSFYDKVGNNKSAIPLDVALNTLQDIKRA